ncbi:hypothetical protein [Methylopila sp. M107]|uniref:hypothetical protein n=1 Tax=Methylopila sp. M107 TaxID=1101190 RepID=UPI00036867D3|nr:hypothetical protein [Methylopila sp. M107]
MADYFPVISRAVSGLDPNTGEARRKVYERARAAIVKQLRAIDPPVAEEDISRERMQLEEAIRRVEAEAAGRESPASPAPAAPKPAAPRVADPQPAPKAPVSAAPQRPSAPISRPAAEPGPSGPANDKAAPRPAKSGPAKRADGRPIVQPGRDARSGSGNKPSAGKRSAPVIALGALAVIAVVTGLFAARGQIAALFSGGAPTEVAQTPAETKPGGEQAPAAPQAETKSDDRLPQEQAAQDQQAPAPAAQDAPEPDKAEPQTPAAPPAAEAPAPQAEQQARAPEATEPAPAPSPAPAAPSDAAQPAGPLVAQRAVLYEEGPNQQSGEALTGSVLWRTESVSGGSNQPLDTALRGEIEIPARNLRAVVTIRRNADATLPASHTIEVQFKLPPDFPNAGVSNVPGVLMKTDESARGAAVSGLSVKVTNGFFLIGLSNVDSEKSVNEQLLRDRSWIDIPILYDNGRRAVLTLEKGTPGKQAFDQAFDAWKSASTAPRP